MDELELNGLDLEPTGVTNPLTGQPVDANDIDELIDCFEHMKSVADQCYAVKKRCAEHLAKMTSGDKNTRRIEGLRRRAKVEMPGDSWDQKALKAIWLKYPGLQDRVLKIDTIGVKAVEYRQMKETTGLVLFESYKADVIAANRGPTSTATITVEE